MFDEQKKIVTIDGPSGVGKSTISKAVAAALGFTYLDTGAMYRAVALHVQNRGIDPDDLERIAEALEDLRIDFSPSTTDYRDADVVLNGVSVESQLRTPEISMLASRVSALPAVRDVLTKLQQKIGEKGSIVAEGRDMGSVVFPDAAHKFFLDARPDERARRRTLQLKEQGEEADEQDVLQLILQRDKNDSQRAIAPLKKAEGAVVVDTTEMTPDQVLHRLLEVIRGRAE